MDVPLHPVRIVHLQGGLRAIDDRSGKIYVQIHSKKRFIHFEAPEYANLYPVLASLGFRVIGVEFIEGRDFSAPDWCFAPPEGQFKLTFESREWSKISHLALKEKKQDIVDVSRRFAALLELLAIRIWQMSQSYNASYIAQSNGEDLHLGHIFDNIYTPHIEASIHAFLADAASLRDLICEFTWTHVLLMDTEVRKIGRFVTAAKNVPHPLAVEIISESDNGWIRKLSKLRNEVLHVAPIGAKHPYPSCQTRVVQMPNGEQVSYLAYGLLDRLAEEANKFLQNEEDEKQIVAELQSFAARLNEAEDALDYAWQVLGQLIDMCTKVRLTSGIRGQMPTITDADIIGVRMR